MLKCVGRLFVKIVSLGRLVGVMHVLERLLLFGDDTVDLIRLIERLAKAKKPWKS